LPVRTGRRPVLRRLFAVLGAATALLLVTASAAHADDNGTWSSSGEAGVHAQGSWKTELSKIYFSGYVRDTACDGNRTKLEISFTRYILQIPEPYRRETVTNTSGCGTNKNFSYNSYQPGKRVTIHVKECVIKDNAPDDCSRSYQVVDTHV
jgi:hypothetical protein